MADEPFIARGFRGRRPQSAPGRLPPGQYETRDFPVLSAGPTPRTPLDRWDFTIHAPDGGTARWTWTELQALPHETPTVDIHCVTKWSKFDTTWEGISVDTLLGAAAERLDALQQRVDRHALPRRVELRPRGDAVDVDGRRLGLERLELLPRPGALRIDGAGDPERPLVERGLRRRSGAEHREAALEVLARWEPVAGRGVALAMKAARRHAGVWQTASALLPSGSRTKAP